MRPLMSNNKTTRWKMFQVKPFLKYLVLDCHVMTFPLLTLFAQWCGQQWRQQQPLICPSLFLSPSATFCLKVDWESLMGGLSASLF